MELELKVDMPVRVWSERHESGDIEILASVKIKSAIANFIGPTNLAAIEANLKLRLEQTLEDYSEGVIHEVEEEEDEEDKDSY